MLPELIAQPVSTRPHQESTNFLSVDCVLCSDPSRSLLWAARQSRFDSIGRWFFLLCPQPVVALASHHHTSWPRPLVLVLSRMPLQHRQNPAANASSSSWRWYLHPNPTVTTGLKGSWAQVVQFTLPRPEASVMSPAMRLLADDSA